MGWRLASNFEAHWLSSLQHIAQRGLSLVSDPGDHVPHGLPDVRLRRGAVNLRKSPVNPTEPQLPVHYAKSQRCSVIDGFEFCQLAGDFLPAFSQLPLYSPP